jgi:hypothetical protein
LHVCFWCCKLVCEFLEETHLDTVKAASILWNLKPEIILNLCKHNKYYT